MRRFIAPAQEEETQIDITPMLDVVFIMLIFFIVTASFVKEIGLDVNKPESSGSSEPSEIKPIVVEVTAQNELKVDGRLLDARSVKPTVVRMIAESPESSIIVQAHKESNTRMVIRAVDGIKAATGPSGAPPTITVQE